MRLDLLSAAVIATSLATSALSADLPYRQPPIAYAPVFTWSGLYVGLNAGMGWANAGNITVTGPTAGSSAILGGNAGDGAFVGGGQAGFNWQSGALVYGLEADIQYVGSNRNASWGQYTWWANRDGGDGGYFGTVRARMGYAIDRTLIYLTGGLAYGGLNSNPLTGNTTSNAGWTLGGGFEYAFTNNWTAKLEGLYVDTGEGRQTRGFNNTAGGVLPAGNYTATTSGGGGGGVLRVGVNYKY